MLLTTKKAVPIIITILIFSLTISKIKSARSTEEWKSRTIYQVLTDRFARTDSSTHPCHELHRYCGGTWKGLQNQLNYIQEMGFDAIWISPIVENYQDSYHGYHATNFYSLNPEFGTEAEFKSLVEAMHDRNMWIMVDVVANHVGPVDMDFSRIVPFNSPQHYHQKCQIDNWNDPNNVEQCRLANLPDLNQDDQYVRSTLINWIRNLVQTYDIDGIRIDTIPEVKRDFWYHFTQAAGCYAVGEAFNGSIDYVASYQGSLPALLNYPTYYLIRDIWINGVSMTQIRNIINEERSKFHDTTVLGVFTDNHDNRRFLHEKNDLVSYKSALAFSLFVEGIPIVYYGSEQAFSGGDDPFNREPLWEVDFARSEMFEYVKFLVNVRKQNQIWNYQQIERFVNNDLYCFSRGQVVIAMTNRTNRVEAFVNNLPESYKPGVVVCNLFYPAADCLKVTNSGLQVVLLGGEVKIYLPRSNFNNDFDINDEYESENSSKQEFDNDLMFLQ